MGDEVMKRSFAVLLALLVLVMAMPVNSAMASSVPDGQLTITFSYGVPEVWIPGATFSLYLVAPGTLTLQGVAFTAKTEYSSLVTKDFNQMKESEFHALTTGVEKYVVDNKVRADYTGKTDSNGQAKLTVPYGIYLIRQTGAEGQAANYLKITSFLAIVPGTDPETGAIIDAVAEPKADPTYTPSPTPTVTPPPSNTPGNTPDNTPTGTTVTSTPTPYVTPSPTPVVTNTPEPQEERFDLTVRKDWADFSNADGVRPESIRLYLYRKTTTAARFPDTPYMNVDVNGVGDQWSFTFFGLVETDVNGVSYEYQVREEVVEGYSPIYEDEIGVITNVHPTNTPEPGTTPTPVPNPTPRPTNPPGLPVGVVEIDGEWYYIDEYGIPLGLVPQTGDETQLILFAGAALLLIAAAVYLFLLLYRRRKEA
ncbi:MAG: Cna B-type domain-containing protein [Clostridiales bacterium]|nr:Cna B-type domain-containing protein [Clostridiales bacterium]